MEKRILKLTLTKHWFDLTAKGLKKEEYRKDCKWSRSRLLSRPRTIREYDEVWYYNGGFISDKLPFCCVNWDGCDYFHSDSISPAHNEPIVHGDNYFIIKNGDVLETRDWKP